MNFLRSFQYGGLPRPLWIVIIPYWSLFGRQIISPWDELQKLRKQTSFGVTPRSSVQRYQCLGDSHSSRSLGQKSEDGSSKSIRNLNANQPNQTVTWMFTTVTISNLTTTKTFKTDVSWASTKVTLSYNLNMTLNRILRLLESGRISWRPRNETHYS